MMAGSSSLSVLDPDFVSLVAAALKTNESFVEKDWHAVRALGVVASVQNSTVQPVFSGGTSLSKGWGLIRRFSEDIDFKVQLPALSKAALKNTIRSYRDALIAALQHADFQLEADPLIGNQGRFFRAQFHYPHHFPLTASLRPSLRIEMTFEAPALAAVPRNLRSLIAEAKSEPAEISNFPCVSPAETAADKLSALAWRALTRKRADEDDDPTVVRHIHDLAALLPVVLHDPDFARIARVALSTDAKRAKATMMTGSELATRFLPTIQADPLWRDEYDQFAARMSYAPEGEEISFDDGLAACARLVGLIFQETES